jgi:cytochrome c oxidase subunit 3
VANETTREAAVPLADHFEDLAQQGHAARLGMWIFLGTEILLFGGLFVGYAYYRALFGESFHAASRHLDVGLGTIETVVLITSSLFAVLGLHFLRVARIGRSVLFLSLTVTMGLLFLVLHGVEYAHEFQERILPGSHYHFAELPTQGANLFFTLYFLMTGLHGLHVIAGSLLVGGAAVWVARGKILPIYSTPLDVVTLYWHLVDILWIFLYPLLYLAG